MTLITVDCDACSGTGDATHEDRHTGTNMDRCRKCGGEGQIPARTGETQEASFQPPAPLAAVSYSDLGQVAYETRYQGLNLGAAGAAPKWADLGQEGKQLWREVALAVRHAPWPPATPGRIVLQVDHGVEGLWYVTSPAPAGLLVAGETMRGALDQVEQALEDMKRAAAELGGDAFLVEEVLAKQLLEPRSTTLAARSLEVACEPWLFGVGDPPDNGSPLHNVFDAGVTYAIRELGKLTKSAGYSLQVGSEDYRNDIVASLIDVLKHAGLYDPDTGRLASLTSVNDQGRTRVEESLTAQVRALEASQRMDGLTAAEWQERWTEQGNTLAVRIGELETVNNQLRATLGNGNAPCVYCSLPREKWGECASGFPGCGRADDAMLCPHVGAELASQEKIETLTSQINALQEQIRKDAYAAFNAKADFEVELDALRLLLRRNEVRIGRQRELLQESNKLLDRARDAEARASRFWAALRCLFPFVDRAVGEGIVFGPDGQAPAIDALDAYTAAAQALGCEELDNPILNDLGRPSNMPGDNPGTVPVLYRNYRGEVEVRNIAPLRFWAGESEWHPGESHFLKVVEPSTRKVRDFAMSGILAWGEYAVQAGSALAQVPAPNTVDPVIEAVRADLHRRSQLGIQKYGTTLAENPAAIEERLQHAYEEALDLSNYLKWATLLLTGKADPAQPDTARFQNRAGASGRATRAADGAWAPAESPAPTIG